MVDAGGRVVAPGFVDLHTHSDVSNLSEPHAISAIEQGVTTQVVGLCGFSAGPVTPQTIATMIDEEPVFGFPDVSWDWRSIGGYLENVNQTGVATNTVTLLGHNTLRRVVMGGEQRDPTTAELQRMKDLMREAFADGARGFTTGLSYAPGCFASTDELVELTRVAAEAGLPYHTHMRYGDLNARGSLEEAIATAERSGVEMNVSHLYPSPSDPPDEADRLIGMIEAARDRGARVTWDTTVFPRGGGAWVQSLPLWALDGGMAAMVVRLRDPEVRARIREHIAVPQGLDWSNHWDDQLIVKVNRPEARRSLIGRTIGDIARGARHRPARHGAGPRHRGGPVLGGAGDQAPARPRPPALASARRPRDRRDGRAPGEAPRVSGSCPRPSGRSRRSWAATCARPASCRSSTPSTR